MNFGDKIKQIRSKVINKLVARDVSTHDYLFSLRVLDVGCGTGIIQKSRNLLEKVSEREIKIYYRN